jgi:hypothetical protein
MNERIREHNDQLKQKLKAIADECFSVTPEWDELMLFLELGSKVLTKDADEWYEKTLWQDKK